MMVPIAIVIAALTLGFSMGVLAGYMIQRPRRPREMENFTEFGEDPRPANITHMPVMNAKPMSEKMAAHLRETLPGFADLEAARQGAEINAERARRRAAMGKAVTAGLAPISGQEVAS